MILPVNHLPSNNTDNTCTICLSDEKLSYDIIFGGNDIGSPHNDDHYTMCDNFYQKPDKAQYIFSNMGGGLTAIHSNNMVTPIRVKNSLNAYPGSVELAKMLGYKSMPLGVFVIDYFTIYYNVHVNIPKIINYYATCNNLIYDDEMNNIIMQKVVRSKQGKHYPDKIAFRMISFVPKEVLIEQGYVFLPSSDIVITPYDIDNSTANPNSARYKQATRDDMVDNKNVFILDITDNTSPKPYFFRIGNKTHRIFPSRNSTLADGATFILRKNNNTVEEITCKLSELSDKIGVYRTEEEANAEGNLELLNNNLKLSLDKEKIDFDRMKLLTEHSKLHVDMAIHKFKFKQEIKINEQKVTMAQLDIEKRKAEQIFMYDKATLDLKQSYLKNVTDMANLKTKHKMDMQKSGLDLTMKLLSIVTTLVKLI